MKWIISDTHGCLDQLKYILAKIFVADNNPSFIFLGDYVDRGPNSKGVIDTLLSLATQASCVFIRGNHDDVVLSLVRDNVHWSNEEYSLKNRKYTSQWFWRQGLRATCQSYYDISAERDDPFYADVDLRQYMPESHKDFLQNTVDNYDDGIISCGHAAVWGNLTNRLWTRRGKDEYIAYAELLDRRIFLGHTPVKYFGSSEPIVTDNVVLLDGGPYSPDGFVSAICAETNEVITSKGYKDEKNG